jgi:hypothetical protein
MGEPYFYVKSQHFPKIAARVMLPVLVSFIMVLFLGCGVKTHPYPEMVTLPGKVLDLTEELDADGKLTLRWMAPDENMAGRPLQSLSYFEVRAADYDREDFCSGCPSFFRKVEDVYAQPPPPGLLVNPGPYYYTSTLKEGRVYRFQVAAYSGRGEVHPDSWSEVTVYAIGSPGELSGFRAAVDDRVVRLYFNKLHADEAVEIERKSDQGPFSKLPVEGSSALDLNVAYGNTYIYRGRKVLTQGGGRAPGPWSPELSVTVEDKLPPRPIAYLDAALAPEGILLKWEGLGQDDDIKGYRLYRRIGDDGSFKPIGGLITGLSYLDKDISPGTDYRYQVTAVDNSPRGNESLPSPEARVEVESEETPVERPDLRDLGY